MNKSILLMIMVFFSAFYVFSQNDQLSVGTFMSNDESDRVLKGEMISRMYIKYNARGENTHMSIDVPSTKYAKEDFSVYEIVVDEKSFFPYDLTRENKLKLFNTFAAFSKSKGMTYYSRSAGKNETLILNCYRVENDKSNKEVKDITYNDIQPRTESFFLQQDNKFGKIIFKSELFVEDDNFILKNTSIQAIANTNNAGDFKTMTYLIYDKTKKGYFVYSANVIRVRNDLLTKTGLLRPTTFSNRLRAGTVHLVKMLGIDWSGKLNPWDEQKLKNGEYQDF